MTLNKIYENIKKHHLVSIFVPQVALPQTAHRLGLKSPNCRYTEIFDFTIFCQNLNLLNYKLTKVNEKEGL